MAGSLPVVWSKQAFGYKVPGWKENPMTVTLAAAVKPPLEKVKSKNDVHALTADEWDDTANKFQSLADEHSRLGNLHRLDLVVAANQVALRQKYGSAAVDDLLKNGYHAALTNGASKYHSVATRLRGESPDFNLTCDKGYALIVAELDIAALVLSEVPPIAATLAVLSIAMGIAGIFMCP